MEKRGAESKDKEREREMGGGEWGRERQREQRHLLPESYRSEEFEVMCVEFSLLVHLRYG